MLPHNSNQPPITTKDTETDAFFNIAKTSLYKFINVCILSCCYWEGSCTKILNYFVESTIFLILVIFFIINTISNVFFHNVHVYGNGLIYDIRSKSILRYMYIVVFGVDWRMTSLLKESVLPLSNPLTTFNSSQYRPIYTSFWW